VRGAVKCLPKDQRVSSSDKIRAYLTKHPGSRACEIIAATGLKPSTVHSNLLRIAVSHHTQTASVYVLKGHPIPDWITNPVPKQTDEPEPTIQPTIQVPPSGNVPWWWGVETAELNPV
jgi:hypothetical protein